jgi:hypothetical protein
MAKRQGLSKAIRFDVMNRDGFQCQYCGGRPPDVALHVDHRKPVADGGTDDLNNLVTACDVCNLGKSDKPLKSRQDRSVGLVGKWFMEVQDGYQVQRFGQVTDDLGADGVMIEHCDYVCGFFGLVTLSGRLELVPKLAAFEFRFYATIDDLAAALGPLNDRMDRERQQQRQVGGAAP